MTTRTPDDPEEWWRHRLGRLVVADDEAVVRALFARGRRPRPKPAELTAVAWRGRVVERNWSSRSGPQVVTKVAGSRKDRGGVWACVRYVARLRLSDPQPVPMFDEYGRAVDPRMAFEDWHVPPDRDNLAKAARERPDLGADLPIRRRLRLIRCWHLVWSVPQGAATMPAEERRAALMRATHRTVDALFTADGYRVLWGLHEDTPGHPHVHVVVLALSRLGRRLRFDRQGLALDAMRTCFAESLTLAGLPHQASRREDRSDLRRRIMGGQEPLRWPTRWQGQGDLARRAPSWLASHGTSWLRHMQSGHAPDGERRPWWRRLLPAPMLPEIPPIAQPAHQALAVVYRDPAAALRSWLDLALSPGPRPNGGLALWVLRHRPEVFGTTLAVTPAAIDRAVAAVKDLPLRRPFGPGTQRPDIADAVAELRWRRRVARDRVRLVRSLVRLAQWTATHFEAGGLARRIVAAARHGLDVPVMRPDEGPLRVLIPAAAPLSAATGDGAAPAPILPAAQAEISIDRGGDSPGHARPRPVGRRGRGQGR
ncbi:conserved hypothetical protein [Magnetospirillum sp. LM-5]|uniref:hypothetical protein n=1 Tax=Magnetospirillum sp. LM-5 TaxID=2681466 RepID=UPI001383B7AE|nr:hypothetical protein [Magnetospirillum sp. LM-5]CAA7622241.1 conserved hypothetical protein [Magnetospirillum sp. LM-5]